MAVVTMRHVIPPIYASRLVGCLCTVNNLFSLIVCHTLLKTYHCHWKLFEPHRTIRFVRVIISITMSSNGQDPPTKRNRQSQPAQRTLDSFVDDHLNVPGNWKALSRKKNATKKKTLLQSRPECRATLCSLLNVISSAVHSAFILPTSDSHFFHASSRTLERIERQD